MSAQIFRLPDLGEGLTEAALVKWLVKVGDAVRIDQPIAEVETAKSIVEVPSPYAGTVSVLHGEEGETLEVGAPLVEVAAEGGEVAAAGETAGAGVEAEAYRAEERAGSGNVLIGYGTTETTRHGRTRKARGATATSGRPAAAASTVLAAGPLSAPADSGRFAVRSPIVRRLARDRGVDLREVTPTGADGVITRSDVLEVAAAPAAIDSASARSGAVGGVTRSEPLSMLRKAVSAKMSRSRAEIPEATVWVDVDVTELFALRRSMAVDGRAPSFTAMIARFVVTALAEYPVLGARLSADGTAIEYLDGVHLGVAADTERGLLVPVVRHAETMSIADLDEAIRELAEAARSGTATPAQLGGSTFTLNNYGSLGVDGSAAIINHPEVAILGLGRAIDRAWVVDGAIVPRRIVQVSLVFDHRVCDGGYAAGFLRSIVESMEHPLRQYRNL